MTQHLDRSQNTDATNTGGTNPAEKSAPVPTSASRRVRARLARRITGQRNAPIRPVLEPLVAVHRELYPKADFSLLQRATISDSFQRLPIINNRSRSNKNRAG